MISGPKLTRVNRALGTSAISTMTQRSAATPVALPPSDLLHTAMTYSSVALAVCDHAFTVRFCNPAICRLIGRAVAASDPSGAMHGATMLGLLGVEGDTAMAEILSRRGWQGVTGSGLHVAVEAFQEENCPAGWLITVHEHVAPPAPAHLSDQALIAQSDKLTAREREVMLALQEGASNKVIAQQLNISPRTVEFHRARIMQRFSAKSVVDLVRRVTSDARSALAAHG